MNFKYLKTFGRSNDNLRTDIYVVGKELDLKDMDLQLFVEFPWEESLRLFKSKGFSDAEAEQKARLVIERINFQSKLRMQSKIRKLVDLFFSVGIGIGSEITFGWKWLFILTASYSIIRAIWLLIVQGTTFRFGIAVKNIMMQLFLTAFITTALAVLTKYMTHFAMGSLAAMILIIVFYGIGVIGLTTLKLLKN